MNGIGRIEEQDSMKIQYMRGTLRMRRCEASQMSERYRLGDIEARAEYQIKTASRERQETGVGTGTQKVNDGHGDGDDENGG